MAAHRDHAAGIQVARQPDSDGLGMGPLDHQRVRNQITALVLERVDAHLKLAEGVRARALVQTLPHFPAFLGLCKGVHVEGTQAVAEDLAQVNPEGTGSGQFRGGVLRGKAVPGWIQYATRKLASRI
jgi:hypothetical protein